MNINVEIDKLKYQIEQLQAENKSLRERLHTPISLASREQIEKLVNSLLEDEKVNIDLLPDCLEKKIYEKIITILINIIDKFVNTIHIDVFNHKLSITLEPQL